MLPSDYAKHIEAARDRNGQLFKQVQRALLKIAGYIVTTEAADTPNHAARLAWAAQLRYGGLDMSESHTVKIMPMVTENAAIMQALTAIPEGKSEPDGPTDSDVQWTVEFYLNSYIAGGA